MRIYTSYFAKVKTLQKNGIVPVSLARWSPRWYSGEKVLDASPTPDMLGGDMTREEYVARYSRILQKLDIKDFVNKIAKIGNGKPVALLCYEKPDDFCHRHLLAEYMNKNGYEVNEYKENEQLALF